MGRRTDSERDGAPSSSQRHRRGDRDDHRDRDRHRRHRSSRRGGGGSDVDADDGRGDRRHHARHHRRGGEAEHERQAKRSHRRPRREHRSSGGGGDDAAADVEYDDDDRRSRRHRRHREADEGRHASSDRRQRGRKHRRTSGFSEDDDVSAAAAEASDAALEEIVMPPRHPHYRQRGDARSGAGAGAAAAAAVPSYQPATAVDWSSRRGRQRLPGLAYDVDQQRRLLGFLDRRDAAARGRGGRERATTSATAAPMEFTIGPDGLVQMPPPPTLVRRHQRSNGNYAGGGGGGRGGGHRGAPQQRYSSPVLQENGKPVLSDVEDEEEEEATDSDMSVASHESLYDDPATAHLGILPDVVPPSNLYRVALYGVDLSLTAAHLSSVVAQLLGEGAAPWRVRRPAREVLHAATASVAQVTTPRASVLGTAQQPVSSAVLAASPAPASSSSTGVLGQTTGSGVLADEEAASGVLGHGAPAATGVLGSEASPVLSGTGKGEEGVLPDASSLPPVPPPAAPLFYLPGLHDVQGPGGMVVLEFTNHGHAMRTVQLLNGAYMNGRRVAASL